MRPSQPFRDQAPEAYLNLVRQKGYLKACGLAPGLLALVEALTELPAHRVTEALQVEVSTQFPGKELVDLTHAIALINAWNRLGVAFLPQLPALEAQP